VCSRVGGVPEVFMDGVEGFLVPARDVKGMAARALEILTRPELHEQMAAAARRRALSHFCASKIIPIYEQLYERVLGSP
jgi:glycosyltransferase involved in cell wall biosynthesis